MTTNSYLLISLFGVLPSGDSPQFSTPNAKKVPIDIVGSAITLVICFGFGLTILSMQIFNPLMNHFSLNIAVSLMAIGPLYGLYSLYPLRVKNPLFN